MLRVRILGCGSSSGVPLVGPIWGECDPNEPKNHRTRASILLEEEGRRLLIDSSPDVRSQLLRENIAWVDGVFYTHMHADHVHGINDVALLSRYHQKPINIYADSETLADIKESFSYIFKVINPDMPIYNHYMNPHQIHPGEAKMVGFHAHLFDQDHGFSKSLGVRVGNFAYSTDVVRLPPKAFDVLKGVDVWVVDCLGYHPHATHAHLELTLSWIEKVKPKKAYLTHMSQQMDYHTLKAILPTGVEPAYDGLIIEV